MKFFLSFLLFLFSLNLFSQSNNISDKNLLVKYASRKSEINENIYGVVSFKNKLPISFKIIRNLSEHIAIVQIKNLKDFNNHSAEINILPANDNWKFSPSLENEKANDKNIFQKYIVVGSNLKSILISSKYISVLSFKENETVAIVKCTKAYLEKNIASLNEITFIDNYIAPQTEINIIGYNRSFHGINGLDYNIPNANGKNIVVGVKEKNMEALDLDLYKRILPSSIAASTTDNHATVISSIIGGAGNSFYTGRGMANACKFFPSTFANLFVDDINILNTNRVTIQNHSYGTIGQQFYGAEAKSYDEQLWANKNLLHIFSAGNRGNSSATEGSYVGIANFANISGNFKMAKNVITVAAVNGVAEVVNESSAGPTYDGRLAPQLTALGPNGTSDAAAMVSGAVAVLQQVYSDSNALQMPTANLVKSILYNTATDIYNKGIDYKTGYGLLNAYEAVRLLQQKKYEVEAIANNQQWTKNISIPTNTANVKITLAWTDSASLLNNNKALINDLDLQLIEIATGTIYRPWVLSSFANIDSLKKLPIKKRDSLNTAEQITIALPIAGNYQIKVIGYNVVPASVPFAIAYNIDTLNTFYFTNPQNTTDVDIQEAEFLNVKWKTFVADTNALGNLSISFNAGANWQLIKQGIKIYKQEYNWQIKDTSTTSVLKMETSFGTFYSKNFIVSRVIRTNVDFLCSDSFRLSWNKHVYATSYKIFSFIDSAYLKPIATITDTFKVFRRTDFQSNVYAVEPILGNGYNAARSVAIDIREQGVACFYKALNYTLLDGNKVELNVEISASQYVDSIYFEEVTANGNLIQTYGAAKVVNGSNIYYQNAAIEKTGLTYFRVKIKLKYGAIIYTDIVSVLTTGKQNILFYPNPATVASGLQYVLQQGLDINNAIQFYDASGRYIKGYKTIPNKIDVNVFPTGVILYKLLDTNFKLIEAGKFIIVK